MTQFYETTHAERKAMTPQERMDRLSKLSNIRHYKNMSRRSTGAARRHFVNAKKNLNKVIGTDSIGNAKAHDRASRNYKKHIRLTNKEVQRPKSVRNNRAAEGYKRARDNFEWGHTKKDYGMKEGIQVGDAILREPIYFRSKSGRVKRTRSSFKECVNRALSMSIDEKLK